MFKYKWSTRKERAKAKRAIEFIRRTGREKIIERLKELQNGKLILANDIFSAIILNWSKQ